jgi:hypothetical protein
MSIDEIRALRSAQPFKPFDIILRDGTKVQVALPERMALAPNGQRLGVYEGMMPTVVMLLRLRAWRWRGCANLGRARNDDGTDPHSSPRFSLSVFCSVFE